MVFPVVMYGCESWTIKKAERKKLTLLNCGVGENKSILKEINPEYSLEGLMLKLNLQYFGNLMQRADSLEKTLTLEEMEGRRSRPQKTRRLMASPTQWT